MVGPSKLAEFVELTFEQNLNVGYEDITTNPVTLRRCFYKRAQLWQYLHARSFTGAQCELFEKLCALMPAWMELITVDVEPDGTYVQR